MNAWKVSFEHIYGDFPPLTYVVHGESPLKATIEGWKELMREIFAKEEWKLLRVEPA